MKKKILFAFIFTLCSSSFLFAQNTDFTGHWTGKVMNQYDVTYDFIATSDSLTGKDTHYDGSVSEISNGKITGDSISYDVPVRGESTHVTGKLSGEVLTIHFTYQGYDLSADLKKSATGAK
jgi:hypothetical protein